MLWFPCWLFRLSAGLLNNKDEFSYFLQEDKCWGKMLPADDLSRVRKSLIKSAIDFFLCAYVATFCTLCGNVTHSRSSSSPWRRCCSA